MGSDKRKGRGATPVRVPARQVDPAVAQVMKAYEEAMRHFNRQNFRRAREIFRKVLSGPSRELAERARIHLRICEQRLQQPPPPRLRKPDDLYHYAVSLMNRAEFDQARDYLERALKQAPKADYIHYALASVAAQTGESEEAIDHLARAIQLRAENRFHARNDSDFRLMEDDPRFHDLLYPERAGGVRAGA